MQVSFKHGRCLDFNGLSDYPIEAALMQACVLRYECNSARLALVKLNSPGGQESEPNKVRRQSVAARGVLLEPDNVFIVRRDIVVPVPVEVLGRIVGPWVEPAVAFHVPVAKRNV